MAKPAKETAFWRLFTKLRGKTPQRQVAQQIGVSSQAIQGWKRGIAPKRESLEKLARLFRVPVSMLMEAVADEGGELGSTLSQMREYLGVIGGAGVLAVALDVEENIVRSWIDGAAHPNDSQKKKIEAILRAAQGGSLHHVDSSTGGGVQVKSDAVLKVLKELGIKDPVERLHVAGLIRVWSLDEEGARRLVESRKAPRRPEKPASARG